MRVPCPKCSNPVTVPQELMARGVSRITCDKCGFGFVMRLGDPNANKKEDERRDPLTPAELDGVTTSGSAAAAAGEIGAGARERFIPAQTRSSIKLSPELQAMIAEDQANQAPPLPEAPEAPEAKEEPAQPAPTAAPPPVASVPTAIDPLEAAVAPAASETAPPPAAVPTVTEAPQPAAPPPPPSPPSNDSGGFESFGDIDAEASSAPAPAAAAIPDEVPEMPGLDAMPGLDGSAALPQGSAPPPPAQPVTPAPAPSQAPVTTAAAMVAQEEMDLYGYGLDRPREGRFVRFVGMLMLFGIIVTLLFGLFVLYRNNWNVDFANLDKMLDKALGGGAVEAPKGRLIDELTISKPAVAVGKFITGKRLVTASGVIRNNGPSTKRYVYVVAHIRRGDRIIATAKAPAGNNFSADELATLDKVSLHAQINPAGKSGRNAKIIAQQAVEYMVVFTALPEDFSTDRYNVTAKIASVERYDEP